MSLKEIDYKPLLRLKEYCENRNFKGYDVGDGAEAWLMRKTPLKKSAFFRFLFVQLTGHRLAFINLRPLLGIKTYHNAKGIALFLNAYCNIYEVVKAGNDLGLSEDKLINDINRLADLLINLGNRKYGGIGWGYPIVWQSTDFCFPPDTPTAVASSFAVDALFHAYEITKIEKYKDTALECADFVVSSLGRQKEEKGGFYFTYSPIPGNNGVFNASMLACRILLQCNKYKTNPNSVDLARQAMSTCVKEQKEDGSWVYGILPKQKWIDNFHTGYNLEALWEYQVLTGDLQYSNQLAKGADFMIKNHFDENHVPKYFHNKQFPIDIHCCGEIFVVLNKLGLFEQNEQLADDVYLWTIDNMQDRRDGYFYFQKRKYILNRASLMRWSNAFMMNALSYYLKSKAGL